MSSGLAGSALVDFVAVFLHNGVPWSVHLFACCPSVPFWIKKGGATGQIENPDIII